MTALQGINMMRVDRIHGRVTKQIGLSQGTNGFEFSACKKILTCKQNLRSTSFLDWNHGFQRNANFVRTYPPQSEMYIPVLLHLATLQFHMKILQEKSSLMSYFKEEEIHNSLNLSEFCRLKKQQSKSNTSQMVNCVKPYFRSNYFGQGIFLVFFEF